GSARPAGSLIVVGRWPCACFWTDCSERAALPGRPLGKAAGRLGTSRESVDRRWSLALRALLDGLR
ncbi:MAG TPA: hypothetical protein VHJ17_21740, partial [Thermomonospora sp.]|nr:hypothetical protein [Thermomonospora sp.]